MGEGFIRIHAKRVLIVERRTAMAKRKYGLSLFFWVF